jgi:polyhydroxyalkanoate synthase
MTSPLKDDLGLMPAFALAPLNALFDPMFLVKQQFQLWQDATVLGREMWLSSLGFKPESVIDEPENDRRFQDELWQNHPLYHSIKQAYLLVARSLYNTLTGVPGLDVQTAGKVEFFTRQFIDALAPTNFLATNPAAQQEFMRTGGLSALKGLRNLLQDLERGNGNLRISMSDADAFELGENIATTPGKVVYQNAMMRMSLPTGAPCGYRRRPVASATKCPSARACW